MPPPEKCSLHYEKSFADPPWKCRVKLPLAMSRDNTSKPLQFPHAGNPSGGIVMSDPSTTCVCRHTTRSPRGIRPGAHLLAQTRFARWADECVRPYAGNPQSTPADSAGALLSARSLAIRIPPTLQEEPTCPPPRSCPHRLQRPKPLHSPKAHASSTPSLRLQRLSPTCAAAPPGGHHFCSWSLSRPCSFTPLARRSAFARSWKTRCRPSPSNRPAWNNWQPTSASGRWNREQRSPKSSPT